MNTKVKLDCSQGECAIIVRGDLTVDTYVQIKDRVAASHLLALGLSWALENEEWRTALIRKARKKVVELTANQDQPPASTQ
jgi:hypothetical protein